MSQQKIDWFLSCYGYATCKLKVSGVNIPHVLILKDKTASTTTCRYLSTLILQHIVMKYPPTSVVAVPEKDIFEISSILIS